jgi:hypothetical protein
MRSKLLLRNNPDGTEVDGDRPFDGNIPPFTGHPLMRPSLMIGRDQAAPPSIFPRRSASARARLLRSAFNKDAENLEAVLGVFVNSQDEIQTPNCLRLANTDEIQGEQAERIGELIAAGYALVGLLVLPPSDRIDDYMDASGVLRWPAETWASSRSVEESKGFIAHVAEALVPASYHLRHVPEQVSTGHSKSSVGRTSPRG